MIQESTRLCAKIPETLDGKRLDYVLAQLFSDYSRAKLQQWVKDGQVQVDGCTTTKTRTLVMEGQEITLQATFPKQDTWIPQEIALDITYEDEHLLVINKPVGLVVHPGAGNPDHTLVNALLHHCSQLSALPRAGIVHRIDKGTSGLLVVAKTLGAHTKLVTAIQRKNVGREYRALVEGYVISGATIDKPIGRHPTQRTKMAVVSGGKPAVTHYRVLEHFKYHTLLQVNLETGRTHQIRVHLANVGFPIVGDATYGKKRHFQYPDLTDNAKNELTRFSHQALHAYKLSLIHPITQNPMSWIADLPHDFVSLLEMLR